MRLDEFFRLRYCVLDIIVIRASRLTFDVRQKNSMALYAPPSQWFFETPIGQCGVASYHTQYSFLYYGRITIEVHMPFEEAKAAYPSYSVALAILGLLVCYAGFDLVLKVVKLYRSIRLRYTAKKSE